MKKLLPSIIFCFIALCYFLTTPKLLLFYDAPEYLNIISRHSLFESIGLGHAPIKPFFMGILWCIHALLPGFSNEYRGNLTAYILGIVSIYSFWKLSGYYLKFQQRLLALFIFSFFPAIWIVNTNLLVESLSLSLFILAAYFLVSYERFKNRLYALFYILAVTFLVSTHVENVIWIPSLFLFSLLLPKNKIDSKKIFYFILFSLAGIIFSLLSYSLLFAIIGKPVWDAVIQNFFGRIGDHYLLSDPAKAFLLACRNSLLVYIRGFGTLSCLAFVYVFFRKRSDKKWLVAGLLLLATVFISGGVWTGDFMMRRVVMLGVFMALFIVIYFRKKSIFLIIFLIPIAMANAQLSYRNEVPAIGQIDQNINGIPKNQLIIQTRYLTPFTHYDGQKIFIGNDDVQEINKAIAENKRIIMDSQAVFAPYLLYIGNNLHVTSLGKFETSETQDLFSRYSFELFSITNPQKRIFTYTLSKAYKLYEEYKVDAQKNVSNKYKIIIGKAKPGSAVQIYSNRIGERIQRERIDYGDIGTWIWVGATNKHDPIAWTYADKNGIFMYPIEDTTNFFVKGKDLYSSEDIY